MTLFFFDINALILSIAPMPHATKTPLMMHDARFIAQMMDRALLRTSSHATTRAEPAYPPGRTTWAKRPSVDKTI